MSNVQLKDIRKSFGNFETIHGVDLTINDGDFVVLVGPSGCGKSTLLRLIAGLEDITSGELSIDGRRVNADPPSKRGIAMVFQSYALYPHMNVFQNMAFGLEMAQATKAQIEAKVKDAAAQLELTPYLTRLPRQLSGGQRQRVAIGRAIVREPKVFLFDEPLSNLDAGLRVQMRLELARLHRELKATTVYVTHDQVEAMTLASKIVVLNSGNVEQIGAPLEIYNEPANVFVATFLGSPRMNIVPVVAGAAGEGRIVLKSGDIGISAPLRGAGAPPEGTALQMGIRPEHITINGADADVPGMVETIENLGESHLAYLRLASGAALVARGDGAATITRGDMVKVKLTDTAIRLFDAKGAALKG
ncbi:MAG: sn-glycerol-3-phosphate ABC transporter ATP-binding protein UgpC [Hyphomicrobiales bacterium]|nr:sn-glycerol-3-phosphate ABC transporter ATP-binding protein UgpC [Hyphomicrobiales bacterium]